jgi:sensor histidine kinase YesM
MHINHPAPEIDYMLYETRNELIDFSQMADTKANILLSISSVLATISITKFTEPDFTVPIVILVVFMLGAIFFSLLAVTPSINLPHHKKKRVTDPDFNALFFGDYSSVSYEEYLGLMEQVMNDSDRVYEAQVREIYSAGKYLQRTKYNYIKFGYFLFFAGMISSIASYLMHVR